jgi:hypothetical protein
MDPTKYAYFTDSHIHTGIPLQRMLAGAEILRYTSTLNPALVWTDDDTARLTANLVVPVMQTFNSCNCRFMNQHLYTTIGKMSGAIFTADRQEYNKAVEWFTVNKDAWDQGQNGSIKQLFRLVTRNDLTGEAVTPQVQHVEMGRDQAHGAGDLTNAEILARLMIAQGTKVDPVTGTASTAANAVGPYEFLDDRILAAAELYATHMIGYQIPWVPTASHMNQAGEPTVVYKVVSDGARGRTTTLVWELFYYYKYVRGFDMEQRVPNFTRFFASRSSLGWSSGDGGDDMWLGIPAAAAQAEGTKYQMKPVVLPYFEVEDRFTALDGNSVAMQDGTASYVRVTATTPGSALVVFGYGAGGSSYALRIRTNGTATLNLYNMSFALPNTQGEWRYLLIPRSSDTFQKMVVSGAGTTVDIDHLNINASTDLTPPVFTAGADDLTLYSYAGNTLASTFDFSATNIGEGQVITYQADNLPQGASFDSATGAFSWTPAQAGTYDFIVSVSDGTTTTAKRVKVIVDADRQGAVNTAKSRYNPSAPYVASTVPPYTSAYADIMAVIGSASDADFFQKLTALRSAANGLQELSPLLSSDGSLDYPGLLWRSEMDFAHAKLLTDADPATSYVVYVPKTRVINMDFGPNFKVAANRFDLQAVLSFPERGYGIAIFASNDNETWTRLTPDLSVSLDEMQTLPVTDDVLKNTRFRFFQIRMVDLVGDTPLQLGEFRIFGSRYENVHKVSTVSLTSPQGFKSTVLEGQTMTLSFVSEEPINNVTATIHGMPATVTSADNLHWTASVVVTSTTAGGPVKFLLNYKTQAGLQAEPIFTTTDDSHLAVQESANFLGNVSALTTMSNSNSESQSVLLATWNALSDRNVSTASQFRVGGSGTGAWLAFDFKAGGTVKLSKVDVLALQDGYSSRINGAVVQGSNDKVTWTTISNAAYTTTEWQSLKVTGQTPYRYIRIYNPNTWYGSMTELRMYGVATSTNKIATSSLSSAQAVGSRVVAGDTVKLNFTAKEALSNVSATIAGLAATVTTTDNVNYTATATLPQNAAIGPVTFAVNYKTQAGTNGYTVSETTDGTALSVFDNTGLIANPLSLATVTDSGNLSPSAELTMANKLFDNSLTTMTDYRINNSGSGSWVAFDFRGGGTVQLSRVDVSANPASLAAFAGTVVQGSSDYANWTTISSTAVGTQVWQTLTISDTTPYRYVRLYNPNAWYGVMGELRLFGTTASINEIASASLSSTQALRGRILPGSSVKLNFTAKEAISNVSATIQGVAATLSTTDNINFTATATLPQGVATGAVKFNVTYKGQSGQDGYPLNATTDGTALNLVDETDVIKNLGTVATLIDSTTGRTAASTLSIVNSLFDSNLGSGSDFRNGTTSGSGAYIVFDFKAGNQVNLTNVELIGPQDSASSRMAGVVVQGSNDGASWTTLTPAGVNTQEWQNLKVTGLVPYRYIRIYNAASWFGSMRELRLHGSLHSADTTAPVTTASNVPAGTAATDTTVTLSASDAGSGVKATYYTVDGGAQQTGTSVAFTTDGNHTLAYWSVDWAGNVEQQHTATINVDKPPVPAGLYADLTTPTNQNVNVTIYYPTDAAVREYKLGDAGAWTAYTAPVVVTDNTTVYARSTDATGNFSPIASLVVANINKVPPAGASFLPSVVDPTSDNVTVAITYPSNVAVRQYRINGGALTPYTGPVLVTDNATVYAQSIDSVGNISPVTSYVVSNIDRIAPVDAQFAADMVDATNKDVTVAVVFPADAATKEYKVGVDGAWTPYGAPVLMTDNGVVFARSADAAANMSGETQYVVANIDRIAPAAAALVVDTAAPTNQGVTVTISYPADAAVMQYMIGGGDWTAYTGPVLVAEDSTVYARSADAVGNMSNQTSIVVNNIYKVVPTTAFTLTPASPNGKNAWYTSDVSVTLAVNPGSYGGAVTTEYQVNGGAWIASSGAPIVFGEGTYHMGFRSRDQAGNVEQDKTIDFKVDKSLPTLAVALDKSAIWPPNHKMVQVNAALTAADAASGVDSVVLTNITSNKPDSGNGDVDAQFGTDATSFSLRAEKDRVYTVTYTVTDKAGNTTVKTATVTVPHDQSGL